MNNRITIPTELINESTLIPQYARIGDAGMDVFADKEIAIDPGQTVIVPTGVKMAIPEGYEIQVRDKSGIASSTKLRVANAPGTVDSGYRDEIGVIIENTSIDYGKIVSELKVRGYLGDTQGYGVVKDVLTIDKKDPSFKKNAEGIYVIHKGEKIAQLVLCKVETANLQLCDDVSKIGSSRGGGFGSTGIK